MYIPISERNSVMVRPVEYYYYYILVNLQPGETTTPVRTRNKFVRPTCVSSIYIIMAETRRI